MKFDKDFKNDTPQGFRALLKMELDSRTKRNPSYSLRSFAKGLNVSHSALSQIINGKRSLSKKMVIHLGTTLGLSPEVVKKYSDKVNNKKSELDQFIKFEQRDLDNFNLISNWYYYAILELLYLKDFKPEIKWISKKLNISITDVKNAIDCLERLGYIKIDKESGNWIDLTSGYTTSATNKAQTSVAKKNHQNEIFQKAKDAIDEYSIDKRSHSGVTLAVNTKNLDKVRELIKSFRLELMNYVEQSNDDANEVYQLCVAFFPLTKNEIEIKGDNNEE